ncbi:nucleobase:cation symporter-1, NCS1 family, partial [Tremellales sp. Uapishka_1]
MGLTRRIGAGFKEIGFLQKPTSAVEAGSQDFRPTSGLQPLIHMEPGDNSYWINEDLAPTPPQMRLWTWYSYVSLWWGTNYGVGAFSTGSAQLSVGLSFKTTVGAAIIGNLLVALTAVGAANVGSSYHIGFPVWARSAFGMRGSKFFVGLRGAVAVIWFAVQCYYAAEMMDVALYAVSPNGWGTIKNSLPLSANVTTRGIVAYFLVWCMHVPFAFVHPSSIKILFELKALILPAASFGFLGGLIHLAGGHVDFSNLTGTTSMTTSAQAWSWMFGINQVFGNIAPMLINQPDLGRYANKPSAAVWPQFASMMVGNIIVLFLGLTSGAVTYQLYVMIRTTLARCPAYSKLSSYGEHVWNLWSIAELVLKNNATVTWRAGIFIFSLIQIYATIGTNLFANSIPFACDFGALWPQRINIIRGQLFVMVFSWIVQPWAIISSGVKFVTFLGSYTFFCGAMLASLLADFYIVRRGNLHIPSLFDAKGNTLNANGLYVHKPWGVNPVAVVAWLCGIAVPLPGLVLSYFPENTSASGVILKQIYNSGFLIAFGITGVLHLVGSYFFPPAIVPAERLDEFDSKFMSLAKTDGYFPGDEVVKFGRYSVSSPEDVESPSQASTSPTESIAEKYNDKDVDAAVSVLPVLGDRY